MAQIISPAHITYPDSYQDSNVLGVDRQNKAETIEIDQGLTENSVSEHNNIKLLLNHND